jgi:hypothetical protein
MAIQAHSIETEKPFARSHERFEAMARQLSSRTAAAMTHSELERLVDREGRALLRQMLQDHLDLRSVREQQERPAVVVGDDGVSRGHRRDGTERTLTTLFGDVVVARTGYSARGADSRFPLDAELNLPPDQYSLEVRRRIAEASAQVSFDSTVDGVERSTGAEVAKRQAEELARKGAVDFDAFYAQRIATGESTSDVLVLSTDGKGIVMRPADLRGVTRKNADKERKLKHRLSSGEKSHRKRMATVAAVWTVAPFVRSPSDVVRELRRTDWPPGPPRPRPEHKRVWASVEKDLGDVVEEAFQDALRRDPQKIKQWVALVDGNEPQLAALQDAAKRHDVHLRIVVDLIHVLGYLWTAAWAFFPEGSPDGEQWVTERLIMLLEGKAIDVAAGMRRSATLRKMAAKDRAAVDDCAAYLLKYRNFLHYDICLCRGWPIATGVIEGACRHLIKDRMDLTGARWSLTGAEAVLRLRALRASGDFEQYWAFHEEQELARNHASRYAGQITPLRPSVRRAHMRIATQASPSLSS